LATSDAVLAEYPGAETVCFGDNPDLGTGGEKTITCSAWDGFAAGGEALPEVGRMGLLSTERPLVVGTFELVEDFGDGT
jgi:hypothetical protein